MQRSVLWRSVVAMVAIVVLLPVIVNWQLPGSVSIAGVVDVGGGSHVDIDHKYGA